ncbi:ICMT-domain-containing protein, partial [Auriscalpium vulgare]
PLFLLGCLCTLASGVLRLECYRALGPLFTFEITLRADHKLVTRGPYAYVRHPSYAGVVLGVVGTLLLHFGPGSWFRAVGLLGTSAGWWFAALWTAMETYVLTSILARAPTEDAMLREQFKEEWDTWAARVPYRVFPGIY